MNVTDAFLGIAIILLLVWSVLLQLNLTSLSNAVSNLAGLQAKQQVLLSPNELCKERIGFKLVEEKDLGIEEYVVTAGKSNGQAFFCFYKKV